MLRLVPFLGLAVALPVFLWGVHIELQKQLGRLVLSNLRQEASMHAALLAENLNARFARLQMAVNVSGRYLVGRSAAEAALEFGWGKEDTDAVILLPVDPTQPLSPTRSIVDSGSEDGRSILLTRPLRDARGRILGRLAVRYSFDEQVARFRHDGNHVLLIDKNGVILAGATPAGLCFPAIFRDRGADGWAERFSCGDDDHLGAAAAVPGTTWYVAAVSDGVLPFPMAQVHALLVAAWAGFMLLLVYVWLHSGSLERYKTLSERDHLTSVRNRLAFERDMKLREGAENFPLSLLMLDIDGLKAVNDTLGHEAGDILLRRAVGLLRSTLREEDVLYRVGGDEFAVILAGTSMKTAESLRDRIHEATGRFRQNREQPPLSMSIGLAGAENRKTLSTLYSRADRDMYEEKKRRREPFRRELGLWLASHPERHDRRHKSADGIL